MPWINREYTFDEPQEMNEIYLCNTITCNSENITELRKQDCRAELIKRWSKKAKQDKRAKQSKQAPLSSNNIASNFIKASKLN